CKECYRSTVREYYWQHRLELLAKQRQLYEKKQQALKNHYLEHREERLHYQRERYQKQRKSKREVMVS
ncbi:MAG: hypothetical protein ABH878_06640, partial [bacterium]